MTTLHKVLICDDDSIFHLKMKHELKGKFQWLSSYHCDEAVSILKNQPIDLLLLDIKMRSAEEGLEFIPKFLESDPDLAIVISSMTADFTTVRRAMRLGAIDYIVKDASNEEVMHTINLVLDRQKLLRRHKQQNFESLSLQKKHILVGRSNKVVTLQNKIEKIKNSFANVVITGETGSGKELVARQLRKTLPGGALEPFLAVDSATIQSSMAESILFGHEKGAFTGAEKTTKGIFEEANGGVVYFDEISNMPLAIQAKLLRVLQEKEVTRIGSSKVIHLEFRVICATNMNLETLVELGEFKHDLLQRLNVIPLPIPPLRDRTEDIPELIEYFLKIQTYRKTPIQFSSSSLASLQAYPWPGNIRELSNLVTQISTLHDDLLVEVSDLPERIQKFAPSDSVLGNASKLSNKSLSYYQHVMNFERELLHQEYLNHKGNISRLAASLGMDRSHLYTKLKAHKIYPLKKSNL